MANPINTHTYNDDLAGAIYFAVGRGTEGGAYSYHLSIAGVTGPKERPLWGQQEHVRDNSGYSIGSIQVDLGQRGTWALGATNERQKGSTTYVDAIIEASSAYARTHKLPYTENLSELRHDLLSHGHTKKDSHGKITKEGLIFIDDKTRDSINTWAASTEGEKWIHENIDIPQIKNLTEKSVQIVNEHGKHISENDRFKTIALLAKTENQFPAKTQELTRGLDKGGFTHIESIAKNIKNDYGSYDGPKAIECAKNYEGNMQHPFAEQALHRAHTKVMSSNYEPSIEHNDADIQQALRAFKIKPSPVHAALSPQPESLTPLDQMYQHMAREGLRPDLRNATDSVTQATAQPSTQQLNRRQISHGFANQLQSETALLAQHSNPVVADFHERVQNEPTLAGYSETERSRVAAAACVECQKTGKNLAGMTEVESYDANGRAVFTADDPAKAARNPYTSSATVDIAKAVETPVQDSLNQMQTIQMTQAQAQEQAQTRVASGPVIS